VDGKYEARLGHAARVAPHRPGSSGGIGLCPADQRHRGGQGLHKPVWVHLLGVSSVGDDEQEAIQLSCGHTDLVLRLGGEPFLPPFHIGAE
jgi:hypothetical protein